MWLVPTFSESHDNKQGAWTIGIWWALEKIFVTMEKRDVQLSLVWIGLAWIGLAWIEKCKPTWWYWDDAVLSRLKPVWWYGWGYVYVNHSMMKDESIEKKSQNNEKWRVMKWQNLFENTRFSFFTVSTNLFEHILFLCLFVLNCL